VNEPIVPIPSIRINHPAHMAVPVIKFIRTALGIDLVTAKQVVCDGMSTQVPLTGDDRTEFEAGLTRLGAKYFISENGDWILLLATERGTLYFHKQWYDGLLWSTSKKDAQRMFKDVAEVVFADAKRIMPDMVDCMQLEAV
jgi:hypothetical protein